MSDIIKNVQQYSIYECLINPEWKEMGHARVLLSRKKPNGNLLFAVFLVGLYCLGVKDVFCEASVSDITYRQMKAMIYSDMEPTPCDINLGHAIIYGGVKYARALGFEPNEDFQSNQYILVPESDIQLEASVEFGKNGKPFYVQGPNDNVDQIIKMLTKNVGERNFDFISEENMFEDED